MGKIGYADTVKERVRVLNSHETTPFCFRVFATYEVSSRLQDMSVHDLIDFLNPSLRSREVVEGKSRVREFYAMSPDDAYSILENIAKISGTVDKLVKQPFTKQEEKDVITAEEVKKVSANRHHFKEIDFSSSLTGKKYHETTNEDGTLKIIDLETNDEVPNNAHPSKKAIIGQAIKDLGGDTPKDESLYQRYHKLTKMILDRGNK